ncbi:RlpA-like double-psi beta-barrel-protein domain-containing protein-containing protein [Russula vinacea]|nr:RlpA-like double-psi beta-barrel-protein domain-containing protein-containing protein [Russula vinacea]
MYKLTFILFAFFSLALPILAVPVPASDEINAQEKRDTYSGQGTWYDTGLGNCGWESNNNELVVAVSESVYSNGAHCGKSVLVHSGGKSAQATVVDSCQACGADDLDMSPTMFQKFSGLGTGVIPIQWSYTS